MSVRVEIKTCEWCGCLWMRECGNPHAYCLRCAPIVEGQRKPASYPRRGRPPKKLLMLPVPAPSEIVQ